jgi:ubiquinol-cytochrome c reductase cytochrome c subunit
VNDDFDVEEEFGFAPAVSATGGEQNEPRADKAAAPRRRRRRRGLGRRITSGAVLFGALALTGGAYAAFATSSGASDTASSVSDVTAGKQLYNNSCIACHGANLQGVKGRGVPLIGVGGGAAYFQVITGRMPASGQGAYEPRKEAKFTEEQTRQIAAYVQAMGGGEGIPDGNLRGDAKSVAEGGELFRLNCASCHGTTFKGAPLSAGKIAPSLNKATDLEMWLAMQTGPESMPVFSDNQLTPDQKSAIIAYVQTLKASKDPGGNGIDRIGPVSEAIVLWVGGVGVLMIAILWIGAKAR